MHNRRFGNRYDKTPKISESEARRIIINNLRREEIRLGALSDSKNNNESSRTKTNEGLGGKKKKKKLHIYIVGSKGIKKIR